MFFVFFTLFFAPYASSLADYRGPLTFGFSFHYFACADWLAIMGAEGGREALDLVAVESDNVASAVKKFWICFHVVTIT